MFLIVSNEEDLTSDYVVLELRKRQHPYFRLNTEHLSAATIRFFPTEKRNGWELTLNGRHLPLKEVRAAYYRRPGSIGFSNNFENAAELQYCKDEWEKALFSMLNSLEDCWVNSPLAIHAAKDKPRQLAYASQIGFSLPETAITNDFSTVKDLSLNETLIAKPLNTALLKASQEERLMFTHRIPEVMETDAASIAVAPLIFQHEIKKRFDIRVTVVGEKVFATEIDSQSTEQTEVDWRRGSNPNLPHRIHTLPAEIVQNCICLTQKLGLRFGAIDLILDDNDCYWFLEINPNGQWAWIENRTGLKITDAIVDEMERIENYA